MLPFCLLIMLRRSGTSSSVLIALRRLPVCLSEITHAYDTGVYCWGQKSYRWMCTGGTRYFLSFVTIPVRTPRLENISISHWIQLNARILTSTCFRLKSFYIWKSDLTNFFLHNFIWSHLVNINKSSNFYSKDFAFLLRNV